MLTSIYNKSKSLGLTIMMRILLVLLFTFTICSTICTGIYIYIYGYSKFQIISSIRNNTNINTTYNDDILRRRILLSSEELQIISNIRNYTILATNRSRRKRIYLTPEEIEVITNIRINKTKENKYKIRVLLVIGVMSKLNAVDRRQSIRDTWFQDCENTFVVACRFFTDNIDTSNSKNEGYDMEQVDNNDLEFMPYNGGYNFALRLLYMFKYFTRNYDFHYFLRLDDDYFLCLDRLLKELPYRPTTGIIWGWVHCEQPHTVRVDEGFMILTRDIIEEVLDKLNSTLQCHPFGDQAVSLWLNESKLKITFFYDNARIIHAATAYLGKTYQVPNICELYLGLHGSYPKEMRTYWQLSTAYQDSVMVKQFVVPKIREFSQQCPYSTWFDYKAFSGIYLATPQLCKNNPVFMQSTQVHKGRERT